MTIKIAFGTTILDQGLAEKGIDGIGQYCQELKNQFSLRPKDLKISPYSFGNNSSPTNAKILPKYSRYVMESLLSVKSNDAHSNYFGDVDLIHSTDQLIPIVRNKPLVATVMDTIPLSHPQFIKTRSRFLKPWIWKRMTQRADHIITISEFSKREIIQFMSFPEEKITVIPLGVETRYFEKMPAKTIEQTLQKFQIYKPFFLFLGSIQPRKNLLRLIKAHASLPQNIATEFPIVIAGKLAWDDGQILQAIQKGIEQKRCIWVNYVSDIEKRCLLQAALGMTFVSLYEGFGLPILEAFASQTPVITSDCTSMPEVSGDGAILADPYDLDSIQAGLLSLIQDQGLIAKLKKNGLRQAQQFTWQKVALDTLKTYQSLI